MFLNQKPISCRKFAKIAENLRKSPKIAKIAENLAKILIITLTPQDDVTGDGTTSTVLLIGEFLKQVPNFTKSQF
jgi:chaperonin GroEL (HSP60 family)